MPPLGLISYAGRRILVDSEFSWTLLSKMGKFQWTYFMVIKNSANTVGQPTQGVLGKAPARFSEHCSVSRLGQVRIRLGQVRYRLGKVRFDYCLSLLLKKCPQNSPKMSTRIHQKCPQKFTKSVHENSPILSMKIRLS